MTRWQRFKCWLGCHSLIVDQERLKKLVNLEMGAGASLLYENGMPMLCTRCGHTCWQGRYE